MLTILVHRDGRTATADRVDPAWLADGSAAVVWVDLSAPEAEEARLLSATFGFHDLAVEDALQVVHHPKAETYDGYLYVILHGIDFKASQHEFATHDADFFVGPTYLVTVTDGTSRTIPEVQALCLRNPRVMAEGPMALMHRIVDTMVDHYRPEVDKLEARIDELEDSVFEAAETRATNQEILDLKRDVASLRRIILPQRDILGRLGRREFPQVSEEVSYRFRDVYDHVVRISDEALLFHDRLAAILEAHLSNVSNRLNEVMKILTIFSAVFMPMTVLTGLYGMNVPLVHFPGGEPTQFWWILGIMAAAGAALLWLFRRWRWW
ncbi:MAG TPA: magnesium/cobalt transporter CorA [Vicinamibacterales bacterium]|nr:magnesium/cobalt transporter CorA [Vicinamibacterales bacterium]HPK71995.1 magnesium/cobalt transporter CorA [Vicinamibacterales bacterium]